MLLLLSTARQTVGENIAPHAAPIEKIEIIQMIGRAALPVRDAACDGESPLALHDDSHGNHYYDADSEKEGHRCFPFLVVGL
jgi:hypothetical protein